MSKLPWKTILCRDLFGLLDSIHPDGSLDEVKMIETISEVPEEDVASRFYVSDWRVKTESCNINYDHLKPGDLLEFERANRNYPFNHWAVYIGPVRGLVADVGDPANFNYVVVHMHGKDDPEGSRTFWFNQPGYPILFGFLAEEIEISVKWRINNEVADGFVVPPRVAVLFLAILRSFGIYLFSEFEKYHVLKANCERFAKFCFYLGEKESRQTEPGKLFMTLLKGTRNNIRKWKK
ncbi:hypothetical protein QYM36_009328 [Artemia franciscana]|uniref:LRAT domain-containing protein n=1 Tax=Artemia franciscana TaxID=6661 RepID=A0AA88HSW9_ARTSF|nr:hypothetical protein QYM36_009328 [Artemia franciscana]